MASASAVGPDPRRADRLARCRASPRRGCACRLVLDPDLDAVRAAARRRGRRRTGRRGRRARPGRAIAELRIVVVAVEVVAGRASGRQGPRRSRTRSGPRRPSVGLASGPRWTSTAGIAPGEAAARRRGVRAVGVDGPAARDLHVVEERAAVGMGQVDRRRTGRTPMLMEVEQRAPVAGRLGSDISSGG